MTRSTSWTYAAEDYELRECVGLTRCRALVVVPESVCRDCLGQIP